MKALYLLIFTALTAGAYNASTSIGSTGTLDRARKFKDRVAVPGHDDSQAWSSSLDLGVNMTKGNSETLFITASATIDHEFGKNELFANFTYAYGEESKNTTEDEFILTASLSRLLTEDKAWYVGIRVDGQHDDLADIDYRFTSSNFVGHYLVNRPDDSLQLSIESGLGLRTESQGSEDTTFGVLYLGQRFNYWITDFTRVYQGFAMFDQMNKIASYQMISEAGIETFLSDSMSFKAYAQNTYDAIPAEGRKKSDLRLISGLSYKF